MNNHEVELAIVVVIEPSSGDSPGAVLNTSLFGDVLKRAITTIVVKRIAVDTGHKNVRVAIIVVIADRRPHRITLAANASLLRHVGEMHVAVVTAVVTVKAIPIF